jgi:uncharacterized coiled-coil DUF342 family protein
MSDRPDLQALSEATQELLARIQRLQKERRTGHECLAELVAEAQSMRQELQHIRERLKVLEEGARSHA